MTSTDARAVTRIDGGEGSHAVPGFTTGAGAAAILFAPLAYMAAAARNHDAGKVIGFAALIGGDIGVLAGASAPDLRPVP